LSVLSVPYSGSEYSFLTASSRLMLHLRIDGVGGFGSSGSLGDAVSQYVVAGEGKKDMGGYRCNHFFSD
jgi:hypothetical protein